jgi:hypothetical protein
MTPMFLVELLEIAVNVVLFPVDILYWLIGGSDQ